MISILGILLFFVNNKLYIRKICPTLFSAAVSNNKPFTRFPYFGETIIEVRYFCLQQRVVFAFS